MGATFNIHWKEDYTRILVFQKKKTTSQSSKEFDGFRNTTPLSAAALLEAVTDICVVLFMFSVTRGPKSELWFVRLY